MQEDFKAMMLQLTSVLLKTAVIFDNGYRNVCKRFEI